MKFTICEECKTQDQCVNGFYTAVTDIKEKESEQPAELAHIRPVEVDMVLEKLCHVQMEEGCAYSSIDIEEIVLGMLGRPVA